VKRSDTLEPLAGTVRRRGRNAVALAKMHVQWVWYQKRNEPVPGRVAHRMTLRANERRLRDARPPFFDGRLLFVQAVDAQGETETETAPEYWARRARSSTLVTVPGTHVGDESFLSRANARVTAEAIAQELEVARRSGAE
jgi:hypothetical protein